MTRERRQIGLGAQGAIATVIGNAAEFYDFVSYAFFATYIGIAFFPSASPVNSLLASVATFGVGFLTRPVGALVLGAYADRFGRKPAMTLTIVLMAIGSGMIALIPPFTSIGIAAPCLVVLARLIQGFSVGGEVGPATSYLLEAAPKGKRGWYGSWQSASQGFASLIAGLLGLTLTIMLTKDQVQLWGWRIPFLLGVLVLPVGVYIRVRLAETLDQSRTHATAGAVVSATFKNHWGKILLAMLSIMGGTTSTYVGAYMTTFALNTLHIPASGSMMATIVLGITGIVAAAYGGWLSDRYGRKLIMIAPRIALVLVVWPVFVLLSDYRSATALLIATATLAALNSLSTGVMLVQISEAFPQAVRSTAMSIAYAASVTLFGGTTQWIITKLIAVTQDPVSPAFFMIATNLPSAVAMFFLSKSDPEFD